MTLHHHHPEKVTWNRPAHKTWCFITAWCLKDLECATLLRCQRGFCFALSCFKRPLYSLILPQNEKQQRFGEILVPGTFLSLQCFLSKWTKPILLGFFPVLCVLLGTQLVKSAFFFFFLIAKFPFDSYACVLPLGIRVTFCAQCSDCFQIEIPIMPLHINGCRVSVQSNRFCGFFCLNKSVCCALIPRLRLIRVS